MFDDDDFDSDDFSSDDLRSERDAFKKMPIYIKAMQLCEFGHSFAAFLESEAESKLEGYDLVLAREYAKQILENAYIIPAKIAGAEGGGLYDLRMENAALIRKAARELLTSCGGIRMFDIDAEDYLNSLREEIEAFRIEFVDWVKSFDTSNYIFDRWGLFNPPGVEFDDED